MLFATRIKVIPGTRPFYTYFTYAKISTPSAMLSYEQYSCGGRVIGVVVGGSVVHGTHSSITNDLPEHCNRGPITIEIVLPFSYY